MKEWIRQLRRGILEFCLLRLLEGSESYGYEIVQHLKLIEELAVSESTVYPILSRLKKEGYLKVRMVPSPGGPHRRYYSITPLGQSFTRQMYDYWHALNMAIEKIPQIHNEEDIS